MNETIFVRVALPVPGGDNGIFQYSVPEELASKAVLGAMVTVPLSSRRVTGFVVGCDDVPLAGVRIRPILAVEDQPLILPHLLNLGGTWLPQQYCASPYYGLRLMVPPSGSAGTRVTVKPEYETVAQSIECYHFPPAVQDQLLELLPECATSGLSMQEIRHRLDKQAMLAFKTLLNEGIFFNEKIKARGNDSAKSAARLFAIKANLDREGLKRKQAARELTARQFEIAAKLIGAEPANISKLAVAAGCAPATLKNLIEKDILSAATTESLGLGTGAGAGQQLAASESRTSCALEQPPELTPDQQTAVAQIRQALHDKAPTVFLLHGITGSGKTEVYLRVIADVLERQQQALLIVPEISLTPQLMNRVRARFGNQAAILHSALPAAQRRSEWHRIAEGQAPLVVGARSALFAPLANPGVIILDEEHENSYKQDEAPRYHTREVAEHMVRTTGGVLILGSATPAIETYYRSENDQMRRLTLPSRIGNRSLAETTVVDMREELKKGNRTIFSQSLRAAVTETLQRHEQCILFLNRRGYSTFVLCRECGHVMKCPHCDVSLTYHDPDTMLCCHYCGFEQRSPEICPHCGGSAIRFFGTGTQKVQAELKQLFPQARVARMDADTTARKGSHEQFYNAFARHEIDILVGTQMVAKGLDIPNVTLVGIISSDTALHLPDFRAAERTFQLITQVSGRAGRGTRPGKVILQTYNPSHYSIEMAARQDYPSFYEKEIQFREEGWYPPFSRLISFTALAADEEAAEQILAETADNLSERISALNKVRPAQKGIRSEILGPIPAPIARIQNRYRSRLVLKIDTDISPADLLDNELAAKLRSPGKGISVTVDINPYSIV
ncbi:MAG TPA: primosomal protein N' [Firmicutes bacterium]|jgi:primosomal protein N' (replication factor Y)|nr:primosomal protein N' [Bacillota bacterium]HAW70257.1 primosomal protein N' [Bacillota bacterium]HAZ22369.1 primosomal protein N' [Bacillota bacterium]HBE07369.1 primosomal protein N' [Bacillota bacterium]HBG44687.1 primosomal protein N' [Bacillota bacterium]